MADLLIEMKVAASDARSADKKLLSAEVLASFDERFDTIEETGFAVDPEPEERKRAYLERESYNLVCAFRDLKSEVTLFAKDLSVPFSNNQTESGLQITELQLKISGPFRASRGTEILAKIHS